MIVHHTYHQYLNENVNNMQFNTRLATIATHSIQTPLITDEMKAKNDHNAQQEL